MKTIQFEESLNDSTYGKNDFSEKYIIMTHLFHSRLQIKRKYVNMDETKDVKNFIKNNSSILRRIKKGIERDFFYEAKDFQVFIACSFFLNIDTKIFK